MNRGTKTFVALTIMAWGMAAALVFQRAAPTRDPPVAGSTVQLDLRGPTEPQTSDPAAAFPVVRLQTPAAAAPSPAPAAAAARALTPMDPGKPPPRLARSFPEADYPIASRWGAMLGLAPTSGGQAKPPARTHKIVDGDTLKALARRYLGSADRFAEIYEMNRDVLPNPEVLPIGAELKIPPRQQDPSPTLTPDATLVPARPPAPQP